MPVSGDFGYCLGRRKQASLIIFFPHLITAAEVSRCCESEPSEKGGRETSWGKAHLHDGLLLFQLIKLQPSGVMLPVSSVTMARNRWGGIAWARRQEAEPAWTATGGHPSANGLKQASIFLCISNKLRNNMRKKKGGEQKRKKKGCNRKKGCISSMECKSGFFHSFSYVWESKPRGGFYVGLGR